MIRVTHSISINDEEVQESFTRSGGAGGQHVNTTDSAVLVRFDVANSPSLPERVKERLAVIAGTRMTRDGVLILRSEGSRSQLLNRQEALERLIELIREATLIPKKRRPTRPSRAAKAKRIDQKKKRSGVKNMRSKPDA